MMDTLDTLIEEIKESTTFGAEGLNQLHGATSRHPWCKGKTFDQRKQEVLFTTAGRNVSGTSRHRVETLTEINN